MSDFNEMKEQIEKHLDSKTAAKWAADCAERVLRQFEDVQAADDRPRKAIAACRSWIKDELHLYDVKRCAREAHAAAREAHTKAAIAAARAAGNAAEAIQLKERALYAAEYARKSIGYLSENTQAVDTERAWQMSHLNKLAGK